MKPPTKPAHPSFVHASHATRPSPIGMAQHLLACFPSHKAIIRMQCIMPAWLSSQPNRTRPPADRARFSRPFQPDFKRHLHVHSTSAPRYLEWKAIRVKDVMLPARDDSVQLANPLPKRIPMKIEILRRELEVER